MPNGSLFLGDLQYLYLSLGKRSCRLSLPPRMFSWAGRGGRDAPAAQTFPKRLQSTRDTRRCSPTSHISCISSLTRHLRPRLLSPLLSSLPEEEPAEVTRLPRNGPRGKKVEGSGRKEPSPCEDQQHPASR